MNANHSKIKNEKTKCIIPSHNSTQKSKTEFVTGKIKDGKLDLDKQHARKAHRSTRLQ